MQGQYKYLLHVPSSNQWQNIIKNVLYSKNNVTIVQMKNFPEELYTINQITGIHEKIYQQRFSVIFYSNYLETINYLQHLEKLLPNSRWIALNYQVAQYPVAKVEMEFAILYEKTS